MDTDGGVRACVGGWGLPGRSQWGKIDLCNTLNNKATKLKYK